MPRCDREKRSLGWSRNMPLVTSRPGRSALTRWPESDQHVPYGSTADWAPRHRRVNLSKHPEEVVMRLRKIEGQVSGIRKMYEEGRYCIDVLDQISAARAGLEATGMLVLDDHVNGCVKAALDTGEASSKTAEMMAAVRRFVRSV